MYHFDISNNTTKNVHRDEKKPGVEKLSAGILEN